MHFLRAIFVCFEGKFFCVLEKILGPRASDYLFGNAENIFWVSFFFFFCHLHFSEKIFFVDPYMNLIFRNSFQGLDYVDEIILKNYT